ncbi:hypothetical protein HanIR_Chr17g0895031 [Helianthus annuus]|nr:hypothetical protein HanIR_Chr17g0895031 [Helianthus annuus]
MSSFAAQSLQASKHFVQGLTTSTIFSTSIVFTTSITFSSSFTFSASDIFSSLTSSVLSFSSATLSVFISICSFAALFAFNFSKRSAK